MRNRAFVSILAVMLIGLGAFSLGSGTEAQDTSLQGHPLVGTWLADTNLEMDNNALDLFQFSSDGGYLQEGADSETLVGAWEATGNTTAILTIVDTGSNEDESDRGTLIIRASIVVSADGNSLTADYTLEFIGPDGIASGQAGPAGVTAERMLVEAPGTPVITFDELFANFEG